MQGGMSFRSHADTVKDVASKSLTSIASSYSVQNLPGRSNDPAQTRFIEDCYAEFFGLR